MSFEDRLDEAMRATANSVEPPVAKLVDGGIARGRRKRRHRVAAAIGGVLAATAVVAGGAVALPDLMAGSPDVVADGPAAAPDNADASAAPQATAQDLRPFSEEAVLDTLAEFLPAGFEVIRADTSNSGTLVRWAILYDDGDGAGYIYGHARVANTPGEMECPIITNGGECEVWEMPDGSQLRQITGQYYPNAGQEPDRLQWSATLVRPDGFSLTIAEINARSEKGSQVTRPEPPLSQEEMAAIVTSDRWQFAVTDEMRAAVAAEEREKEAQLEEQRQEEARALQAERPAAEALSADLGGGWEPHPEIPGALAPPAELAADLTHGYGLPVASRHVLRGGQARIDDICAVVGTEKGLQADPCIERTTSDGHTVQVRWYRSVADDPHVDHPGGSISDKVTVLHAPGNGTVVDVVLWLDDPVETHTAERRAAAVSWLEGQVDALIGAATVDDLALTL